MKKRNKNRQTTVLCILVMLLPIFHTAKGQEASAHWPLKRYQTGLFTSGQINAENYKISSLNSTLTSDYVSIGIPSGTLNLNKYIQFKIAPNPHYVLHVDNISSYIFKQILYYARFCIRYSTSPTFDTYQTLQQPVYLVQGSTFYQYPNMNLTIGEGESLYIRVYPYEADLEPVNLVMHDFIIRGTTTYTGPTATISYSKSIWCTGEGLAHAALTGTEGGTYSAEAGLEIDPSTGTINLAGSLPGDYTVCYTLSGITVSTTAIAIRQAPDCSITGAEGTVFPAATVTFSAPAPEGITTYYWSVSGDAAIAGSPDNQTVTVQAHDVNEGSFTVELTTTENGCTNSCSRNIAINRVTASLSGTRTICVGGSADLTVSLTGEAPWTFTWSDGDTERTVQTYDPIHVITVSPTQNTTYSLTGTVIDGNGNSGLATGEARIYFGPITTAPHIIACPNSSLEVPVTVKSFNNVRDISLTLQYDPAVMIYRGFESGSIDLGEELEGIQVSDSPFGENSRALRILKTSGAELPSLPEDAQLLRLLFDYQEGNTELKWLDTPDDSWCSYSFLSELDNTGFETTDFCDVPTELYYINGSVRQLSVSGTSISTIPDISTITGTPVIIPFSVTYPDLEAQAVSPVVLADTRIGYNGTGTFAEGARVFKITYNGNPVLTVPFELGGKTHVLLSEMLGTAPAPLLEHSNQNASWKIYIDGIDSGDNMHLLVEALAYTDLDECVAILDNESFQVSFAGASLSVSESITVCNADPVQFTAEIRYPLISNLDAAVKADARISAAKAFPEGTTINWEYNSSVGGSFTLPENTTAIMLSTITGSLPNPLQGHTGTDVWNFEISNTGTMTTNDVKVEAVVLLEDNSYAYAEDHLLLTVLPLPEVTGIDFLTSADEASWTSLPGNLETGYDVCLDPADAYHYFDIAALTSSMELTSEFERNAFYLDPNSVPEGFNAYWNDKGVNASASGNWQAVMYRIITGNEPMFYITGNGSGYQLVDGLQHLYENQTRTLRIPGDYPAGNYIFSGTVTATNGCASEAFAVTLNMSSTPVIVCQGNIDKSTDTGECGAAVTFAATVSGTPTPEIIYTLLDGTPIVSGHFFPVGSTTVTATATSVNHCSAATCSFVVTVTDDEAPQIGCPVSENVNVKLTTATTYVHSGTDWDAWARDNCSVSSLTYTLSGATEGTGATLENVTFNLGTTTVTWNVVDGAQLEAACSFTVTVTGVHLSGTVMYYNHEYTPLDETTITLKQPLGGTIVATATTGAAGEYSFVSLCPGTYDVEITTNKPVRSINSSDAGQVNAWNVAGTNGMWPSIEKVRFLAGDVNGDHSIVSQDAGLIQNHFLTFGTGVTFNKLWEFWKTNDYLTHPSQLENTLQVELPASADGVTQDFFGLVKGDFNRSNVPASGNGNMLSTKSARTEEVLVTLLQGEILAQDMGGRIDLPLRALSPMKVGAVSLILNWPDKGLHVADVYLGNNPARPAGFNVINNMLVVGWNSLTPVAVEAGEPLVTLSLEWTGAERHLPVFAELVPDPLNELADENMIAIKNACLVTDGLVLNKPVASIGAVPDAELLMTCFPNPFDDRVTIKYTLPVDGRVNLDVTGITGNTISILQERQQAAGEYQVEFDENHLGAGIYTVVLRLTGKNDSLHRTSVRIIKQ